MRMLCHSGRMRMAFLQYGGPGAPSGPASGRRFFHNEDRRMDARRGDSSIDNHSILP